MLQKWKKSNAYKGSFILQEFHGGLEIAVGGWFGRNGFSRFFCINHEFKKLLAGDLGVNLLPVRKLAVNLLGDVGPAPGLELDPARFCFLGRFPILGRLLFLTWLHAQGGCLVHQIRPFQELRVWNNHRLLEVEAEGVGRIETAAVGADDVMELLVCYIQAGTLEDCSTGILAATFQRLP